jgi:hypothetical protein
MKRYLKQKDIITPDTAEAVLDKIGKRIGATPDGMTWLKNALDPFPDVKRPLVGYPDTIKTPSILQYFREERSIATPSIGGVNWDCNIYHPGYYGSETSFTTTAIQNASGAYVGFSNVGQVASVARGGIEVRAGVSGTNLDNGDVQAAIQESVSLEMRNRIVAYGFEVFNTTPELYRSGSITAWRQSPVLQDAVGTIVAAAGATPSACKFVLFNDPPNTAALALNLEGSLEWDAEDGAYCVAVQSDPDNPLVSSFNEEACIGLSAGVTYAPGMALNSSVLSFNAGVIRSPFDQFGVYLTGLNTNTTLKIVKHYLVERFPTYTSADLITMAKPTPAADPRAIELYTQIASYMPTGVPVDDNFIGAFLAGLARVARMVAPVIIPHIANAISSSFSKPKEQSNELALVEKKSTASNVMNQLVPIAGELIEAVVNNNNRDKQLVLVNRPQQQQPKVQSTTSSQPTHPQRNMQGNVFVSNNRAGTRAKRERGQRLLKRAFDN